MRSVTWVVVEEVKSGDFFNPGFQVIAGNCYEITIVDSHEKRVIFKISTG
jgi:hypothetical protein